MPENIKYESNYNPANIECWYKESSRRPEAVIDKHGNIWEYIGGEWQDKFDEIESVAQVTGTPYKHPTQLGG